MARLNVNPTRMEMQKQKGRLKTAVRGHKLLKDKNDEMMRSFLRMVKDNRSLREQVEQELSNAIALFMLSRVQNTAAETEQSVATPAVIAQFETSTRNIMGLIVPVIKLKCTIDQGTGVSITTNANFDRAVELIKGLLAVLIELANVEKACDMLASEVEKTRRRINAIEHVMIPQIKDTIKYIRMKLSENERSQQVRLMKVKEMLEQSETA